MWKDVDIAVNANIGYFLSCFDVDLPRLTAFYTRALQNKTFNSPYYASEYPVMYMLSRVVTGKNREKLITSINKKKTSQGIWNSPLHTALMINALAHLEAFESITDEAISYLLSTQHSDGSWDWEPFYKDADIHHKELMVGAQALTTGFAIEALSNIERNELSKKKIHISQPSLIQPEQIQQHVIQSIQSWSSDGYEKSNTIISKLLQHTMSEQLVILPYSVWKSLDKTYTNRFPHPEQFLSALGEATLYGWIAYTIFDNVIDNESDPLQFSTGLYANRTMIDIFTHALETYSPNSNSLRKAKQSRFNQVFFEIMNTIDRANQWEVTHTRIKTSEKISHITIPKYRELHSNMPIDTDITPLLSDRSMGHILGPIALSLSVGIPYNSSYMQTFQSVFQLYLQARQLNDDAHDWEEDLALGRINAVGSYILTSYKSRHPKNTMTIQTLLQSDRLKKHFWEQDLPHVSHTIHALCKQGKELIRKIPWINDVHFFDALFETQQNSADLALHDQQRIQEFLQSMPQNHSHIEFN